MTKFKYTEPAKEKTVSGFITHVQLHNTEGVLTGNVLLVTSDERKLVSERALTEIELGKLEGLFTSIAQTEISGLGAVEVADVAEAAVAVEK